MQRDDIVAGKADEAINEAIGAIFPGAHVAVTWFSQEDVAWHFELALPQVGSIVTPESATLEELVNAAEREVRAAKTRLVDQWGIEVPGDEA